MKDMLGTLEELVAETITDFAATQPGCRFGLDCNADHGEVFVAVDTSPVALPVDAFLSEDAEGLYSFGDWPIPDMCFCDDEIEETWRQHWSPHADVIRDQWSDLSAFECKLLRKRFLEGVCGVAARLCQQLPDVVPPILVADHDEHIRHIAARMRWSLHGPLSAEHARLVEGYWEEKESRFTNRLAFFRDGEFVNHVVVLDDPDCTVEAEGDWSLRDGNLLMTVTETNWKKASEFLWKEIPYEIVSLTRDELKYRESDGTVWAYEKKC